MYVDTSIIVKLLVREPDSEACAARVTGSSLVSSELAYIETWSALLSKERAGLINAVQRDGAWTDFERQIADESIALEPLNRTVVWRARDVMLGLEQRVPLRTLDALHLATARLALAGPLFSSDRRMNEAARLLGIPVLE